MNQKTRASLLIGILLILLCSTLYLLWDRQSYRESFNGEYQDKVAEFNRTIQAKFAENTILRNQVDSIRSATVRVDTKRESIKSDWREKIVEGKAKCDTVYLNSLDSIFTLSDAYCDTAVMNRDVQIMKLEEIISNDSTIITHKDSIISLQVDYVLDMEEAIKKEKRKNLILKIGGGVLIVLTAISLL